MLVRMMAPNIDVKLLSVELTKLKKDDLVHIIVHQRLPDSVKLPDAVLDQLSPIILRDPANERPRSVAVEVKSMGGEAEIKLLRKLTQQMEERIEEQKYIISTLKLDVLRRDNKGYASSVMSNHSENLGHSKTLPGARPSSSMPAQGLKNDTATLESGKRNIGAESQSKVDNRPLYKKKWERSHSWSG